MLASCAGPNSLQSTALKPSVLYYPDTESGRLAAKHAQEVFRGRQAVEVISDPLPPMTNPRALKQGRPTYPPAMRSKRVSGQVTVEFVVNESGEVAEAVATQSTNAEFEKEALAAVKKWQFIPAMRAGINTRCLLVSPISFDIE